MREKMESAIKQARQFPVMEEKKEEKECASCSETTGVNSCHGKACFNCRDDFCHDCRVMYDGNWWCKLCHSRYILKEEEEEEEEKKEEKPRMVVRATYTVSNEFRIPRGIDLDDKEQVQSWGIKWDVMEIYLENGKTIKIDPTYSVQDGHDFKRPDETEIDEDDNQEDDEDEPDYEDDEEDDEEEEEKVEEKVEEKKEEKVVCLYCAKAIAQKDAYARDDIWLCQEHRCHFWCTNCGSHMEALHPDYEDDYQFCDDCKGDDKDEEESVHEDDQTCDECHDRGDFELHTSKKKEHHFICSICKAKEDEE